MNHEPDNTVYRIPLRDLVAVSVIAIGLGLLLVRALQLQVFESKFLQDQGDARFMRNETVAANRGIIRDRNNNILAISTPVDSVWAEPMILSSSNSRIGELAELINVPEEKIQSDVSDYAAKEKQFIYLRRHLTPEHAQRVMDLEIPGVFLQREYRRYYPNGATVGTLIGYTNIDDVGLEGLELSLNSTLEGEPGLRRVVKDRLGRTIETVQHVRSVRDGKDVVLSIDSRIQQVVFKSLLDTVKKHKADLATGIVINPRTGEILAIATAPGFNPNDWSDRSVTRNSAVTDVFEPGSTIKPFAVAKALMEQVVSPETAIDTSPGYMRIGGFSVEDIRNFGTLSVFDVVVKSSNVGVVKIATQVDAKKLADFYRSLGLSAVTESGLPGEQAGLFPERTKWRQSEHATLTYGYGFAVTPLQLVQAYGAVANGGVLVPLTIKKRNFVAEGRRVLPASVAWEITRMMESVVSPKGTSRRAKVPLYRVAGKSGTVQKLIDGSYSENQHLALFVGFAPVSNPRLAAIVVVDNPKLEVHYGGYVSAPAFREIMTETLRILNQRPDDLAQFASAN